MIKYIQEEDINVLEIPQLNNLRLAKSEYTSKKSDSQLKYKYYQAVNDFFSWYFSYCNSIIKKKYTDDKIAETLFILVAKNQQHWKEYLTKSVYVSKDYVEYLNSNITKDNISIYDHTLSGLVTDLEWLIANYEVNCNKLVSSISLNSWRRKDLNPTDIYSAARTLFFIEEFTNIEDLYLRDLKPNVMFQIRQLLEIFGKNLIGYYSITHNNQPVKKFTQIAWEFINEECKKNTSRITLPFEIKTIVAINVWSNDFVHTTYLHSSHIQYFALKILKKLFSSTTNGITIYSGNNIQKYNIADITISNYNSLKDDFKNYLLNKMPGIDIDWMPVEKVGAYILSQ